MKRAVKDSVNLEGLAELVKGCIAPSANNTRPLETLTQLQAWFWGRY